MLRTFLIIFTLVLLFSGCSISHRVVSPDKTKASIFSSSKLKNKEILFYQTEIFHDFADDSYLTKKPKYAYYGRKSYPKKSLIAKWLRKSYYVYDNKNKILYVQLKGDDVSNSYYENGLSSLTKKSDYIYFFLDSYDNLGYVNTKNKKDLEKNLKNESRYSHIKYTIVRPEQLGYKVSFKVLELRGPFKNYSRRRVYRARILFETLDYRKIIARYKKALAKYDFSLLKESDKVSMRDFLQNDFDKALHNIHTRKELENLEKIAQYGNVTLNRTLLNKKLLAFKNREYLNKHYNYLLKKASRKELYAYLHNKEKLYGISQKTIRELKTRYTHLERAYRKKQTMLKQKRLQNRKKAIANEYGSALKSGSMERLEEFINKYSHVKLAKEYVNKAKKAYKKLLLEGM